MNCISPDVINWLGASRNIEELLERVRIICSRLPAECKKSLCEDTGIAYPTFMAFVNGRVNQPGLRNINSMIGWIAPGKRLGWTDGTDSPVACDPRPPVDEKLPKLQVTF